MYVTNLHKQTKARYLALNPVLMNLKCLPNIHGFQSAKSV